MSSNVSSPVYERSAASTNVRRVFVARDFYATMDSQLSVFCDDTVELLSDADRHWWLVKEPVSGQTGYVPSEIVENEEEHEAKINRLRNVEATRLRESDLSAGGTPWRESPLKESPAEDASSPWSASGFARKRRLCSATQARHRKTVSFSETKPVEHHFAVEESASSAEADELVAPIEELSVSQPGYYDRNVDPLVDELLQREFGKPDPKLRTGQELRTGQSLASGQESLRIETASVLSPAIEPNVAASSRQSEEHHQHNSHSKRASPLPSLPPARSSVEKQQSIRSMFEQSSRKARALGVISRMWKGKQSAPQIHGEQLLRIYAGNFTTVQGYKTMLMEEAASMTEVADKACEKFGVVGDGYDYMLSLVHYDSHEILQVAANYSLGTVIELAKRATLLEGNFSAITSQSLARLPKKLRKQQAKLVRASHGPGLASPLVQLSVGELQRDCDSDFVTHYKFVLNRWLEGPGPTTPFYVKVQISNGSGGGGLSSATADSAPRRPKSPRSPMSTRSQSLTPTDDVRATGGIKMLVNTSMTVAELTRAALVSLDIAAVPGIRYELYLANRPGVARDHVYLTRDMVVSDMLHLRPMVDPSGLCLVLQPAVDQS